MKNTIKRLMPLIALAVILAIGLALVACDPSNSNDNKTDDKAVEYTVTVQLPDGSPAEGISVAFAEIVSGAAGQPSNVTTDSAGVAKYKSNDGNAVSVTLAGLDAKYELPDAVQLDANNASATIRLTEAETSGLFVPDLDYSTPSGGRGTARYVDEFSTQLNSSSWHPYELTLGNYKLKFDQADQLIYIQVDLGTTEYGVYRIYSSGGVDASIQTIVGDVAGAMYNGTKEGKDNDDRPYYNDNKEDGSADFELEFSNNESTTRNHDSNGNVKFEIALENPDHVGHEFAITIEKLDKPYVPKAPIQWTQKHATQPIQPAPSGEGRLHTIPLNAGDFVVVRADDGTYRLGDEQGPQLFAMLGLSNAWPWGVSGEGDMALTWSLRNSYGNLNQWSYDGITGENWQPLLEEYAAQCNADGYYPVNDEIKEFLTKVAADINTRATYFNTDNLANVNWQLPNGEEWIFICGYYGDEYTGPDFSGEGTEDNVYLLIKEGTFSVEVPAGGKIYFGTRLAFDISSTTPGAVLAYTPGAASGTQVYDADGNGFSLTIRPPEAARSPEFFQIYFKDGKAGTVEFTVKSALLGSGTQDDPFRPSELAGEYSGQITSAETWYDVLCPISAEYELTASAAGLTFKVYDLDAFLDEGEPVFSWTSAAGQLTHSFELSASEYFIAVSASEAGQFDWDIALIRRITEQDIAQGGADEDHAPSLGVQELVGAHKIELVSNGGAILPQVWSFVGPAEGVTLTFKPQSGLIISISYVDSTAVMRTLYSNVDANEAWGSVENGEITIPLITGSVYYMYADGEASGVYTLDVTSKAGGGHEIGPELGSQENPIVVTLSELLALTSVQAEGGKYYKLTLDSDVRISITCDTPDAVIFIVNVDDSDESYSLAEDNIGDMTLHGGSTYLITFNINGEGDTLSLQITQK